MIRIEDILQLVEDCQLMVIYHGNVETLPLSFDKIEAIPK